MNFWDRTCDNGHQDLYLLLKEVRDIRDGGRRVLLDSLMDTAGFCLGVALITGLGDAGTLWVLGAILALWFSYPLRSLSS